MTLAALAAYANIIRAFFLSDDFAQIGRVLAGDLSVTWGQSHGGFFRPVFIFSYFIDSKLWGRAPHGFHLTNLLLHSLDAFLAFLLSQKLVHDARLSPATMRAVALAGAVIFLLHPSHTEAVSWISGRADLLATLFALLSMLSFVTFAREGRRASLPLSLAFFALALLSKEAAIALPFMMLCLAVYLAKTQDADTRALDAQTETTRNIQTKPSRSFQTETSHNFQTETSRSFQAATRGGIPAASRDMRGAMRRNVKAAALFFVVLALYVPARAAALGALVGGYGAGQHLNFTHGVVVSQLLRFSLRALFPALLLRSLPFLESRALSPVLIATGATLLLVAILVLRRRERRRALVARLRRNAFGWLLLALYACALLPVINLRINVFDTQGERFLYLPSVFSSLALALAGAKLARTRTARVALLACLLAFYTVTLWQTNRIWRDASALSQRMLDDAARQAKRDSILLVNLPDNLRGAHLYRNGFEEAVRMFQDARPIGSAHVLAFHGLESAGDRIELQREAEGVLTLRLPDGKTTFERVNAETPCVEVLEHGERILRLRLTTCAAEMDVLYFDAGRIFAVETPPR